MVQFKTSEVKNVGKVQVSAKRLRELAAKLEEVRGTDGNEEIDVYIVPGKGKEDASQLAFDFSKKETKVEEKKEPEVKEEKKTVDTPVTVEQQPKVEEQANAPKEQEQPKTAVEVPKEEKSQEAPQSEVERIAKDENLARKAEEIKEKAYKKK